MRITIKTIKAIKMGYKGKATKANKAKKAVRKEIVREHTGCKFMGNVCSVEPPPQHGNSKYKAYSAQDKITEEQILMMNGTGVVVGGRGQGKKNNNVSCR